MLKKTALGIKTFRNCLEIGNLKHKLSTRKLFYRWHHNVFPKSIYQNLVEEATKINLESLQKLVVLNKMAAITYDRNLALFHVYEKGKYLTLIKNKIARKDLHYGFNKWRENYQSQTECRNVLSKVILKTVPMSQKRTAFRKWKNQAATENRLLLANKLLNEYITTK